MSEEVRFGWIVGAIGAAALAWLWLAGALSAALFGAGWTPVGLEGLLISALRLPSHLGDPRLAWPRGARAALPGAAGFYVTAAVIGVLGVLATQRAWQAGKRFGVDDMLAGQSRRPPSARMASARDLQRLRVPSPQPRRLTLGRSGRTLLAGEERQSVIVFAPTETFKTTGFVIPALLEWEGPVLVTSVKGDLLEPTLARRQDLGQVRVFDPTRKTDTSRVERARATPLWGASSWDGAMRVAHWLMEAARVSETGGLQEAHFWFATAEKLVAPLLFAGASKGLPISNVSRWIEEGPEANGSEVNGLLEEAGEERAMRAWRAVFGRDPRQRSSIYMTADLAMRVFADPVVAEETSGADYSPGMLLDGRANTLYLCAPRHEQRRLRPLFSMIVQELLAVVEDLHAEKGKALDPPLLLLLDEAANIAPVPDLAEVASTAAGQGVQLLSVFQDVAQVASRYGRQSSTIVNNHAAKIVGSGISDPQTVDYFSRIVGTGAFEQRSRTSGERGRRSRTDGETYRELAPASVLRQAEPGTGLLIYKHLPPTKIQLRPWFREPTLRALQASPGSSKRGGGA